MSGPLLALVGRLLAVAVVRLVVQGEDALHAHQARHDPLEHLPLGLFCPQLRSRSLQEGAATLRQRQRLAPQKRVVVGDDDLRPLQVAEHVVRHQLAARVVAVRVVRLEHPQPVPDRDAGGQHQEAAREPLAAGPADRVDRLPSDEHRHDRGLAGASGKLQSQPPEARIGLFAGGVDLIAKLAALLAEGRSNLGQPDRGLHRLDLTEKRPDVAEPVAAPVPQEPRGLGRHAPGVRIGKLPPAIHALADAADQRSQVVLLRLGFERLRGRVEDHLALDAFALLRLRDRRDELDLASLREDLVRRLTARVELPVAGRVLVRRVQDRLLEESGVHLASGRPTERQSPALASGVPTAAPRLNELRHRDALPDNARSTAGLRSQPHRLAGRSLAHVPGTPWGLTRSLIGSAAFLGKIDQRQHRIGRRCCSSSVTSLLERL